MIERHYNLSCYVIQPPFITNYSSYQSEHIIDFIDSNNDIYKFDLSKHEIYEKINNERRIKEIRRVGILLFLLDWEGRLIVRRNASQLYRFQKVQEIQIMQIDCGMLVILRTNQIYDRNEMVLRVGLIDTKLMQIQFDSYGLQENIAQNDHFQKYISQTESKRYKIQKLMGKCCLVLDNNHEKFIFRIGLQNFLQKEKIIKYQKLDFQLDQHLKILENYKDKILLKKENKIYLMNAENEKIIELKQLQIKEKPIFFLIYNNFIIILQQNLLHIFQTLKGNKMSQININLILQQFQQGSTIIFNEQINKRQQRYSLLFDEKRNKLTHFYLFDQQKLAVYYFNVNKLLERGFIKTIKESLEGLENDHEKYHQNIMKTMTFRIKKLQTLQKYLIQDLKNQNFSNTIRFLINQPTIYVLNDGLTLFYQAIMTNISKLANKKQINCQLQKEFIRICYRLITESNYENQIANGLHILNGVYTNFRKYQQIQNLQKNKQAYSKLLQTNRVVKLLKNDKKKKLFELSYELALKIKGYKYLQGLQTSKNK